ncbi:MAG: TonB-dependent receptor [Ignavibacteriales bacterium]|nr:TonB-dependent receptor [Ignavibacteriales bacterium]
MKFGTICLLLLSILVFSNLFANGTTGKIAGTVSDARTGEKLIGVNVTIDGLPLGTSTNVEGYYVILNVPPGVYNVKASYIGYAASTIAEVRVSIDQTTVVDFSLTEATISGQEVVVVATRPVVQPDVGASRASLDYREIANLPITQISTVVGLQAGVQGLSVRGGSVDQTAFVLNGLTLRDERDNSPYTAVSLLAVQEIQIQTGGFTAEYGNVRSGVINVVTKEGSPQRYNLGASVRYRPPQRKYFGMPPNSYDSYWIRPYLDPDVAWTGTDNGVWDDWTRRQYKEFRGGWNEIARLLLADTDPTNDISPQAAQQVFLWQHRKNFDITKPDYDIDIGLGGPVPGGENLGNLRFYSFFRQTTGQYAIPLSRNDITDWSGSVKITSDIGQGMKLMLEGIIGKNQAVDANQSGVYGRIDGTADMGDLMNRVSFIDTRLFSTDYWAPNHVDRSVLGAKFTHVLSPETYYEVVAQRFHSDYSTNPGKLRDTSRIYKFGNGYYLDEAPFGFFPNPGIHSLTGIDGMRMAVGMSNARDSSKLTTYSLKGDFVSQIDRYNQVKAGVEFALTDNQVNYGSVDLVLPSGRSSSKWRTYPKRFEAYIKDKLEFEGMIVDAGVRFAFSYAGGEWYSYDPFTKAFKGTKSYGIDSLLNKAPTEKVTAWMPRLNVAFPITENAKLFFNYGHFRQLPLPENLFLVRHETASGDIVRLANPNLPLPKTVAYELGYEHNLLDMFLLRLSGYYKDVSDQSYLVNYIGIDNKPNYTVTTNNSYVDIRGFEFTLTKNRGDWAQGFVNYTYQVSTSGNFGRPRYYEDAVLQRSDERINVTVNRPVPRPYARLNVDFFTPDDFGPDFGGVRLLGDLRMNILASWTSGFYFTWVGGGSQPGIVNNIQWVDQYGADLRFSKGLRFGGLNFELFMDVINVFNIKQLTTYGFVDGTDYDSYLKSLHLPEEYNQFGYGNISGGDKPGDYRKSSLFQPMVRVETMADLSLLDVMNKSKTRPFYYVAELGDYYRYDGGSSTWIPVERDALQRALDDKSYIDMPNQDWFNFLNPRSFYFGFKVSFDL